MGRTGTGKNDKEAIDHQSMMMGMFRPIAPRPVPPGSATEPKKPPYVRIKRRYIKKIKPFNTSINTIINMGNRKSDPKVLLQPPPGPCVCSGGGGGGSREEGSSTMRIFAPQEELQPPPPPPPPPISIYPNKMADYPTANAGGAPRRAVKSWLEVYGMKKTVPVGQEAAAAGGGLSGNSYKEKMTNLQHDICPVLISDCEQRVKYTNPAYDKMGDVVRGHVEEEEEEEEQEEGGGPLVWIVLKDKLPDTWKRFTCLGTVVHIWGKKQHRQTMPCDVWRMDFGEFVWRLDPEAALKLGI